MSPYQCRTDCVDFGGFGVEISAVRKILLFLH